MNVPDSVRQELASVLRFTGADVDAVLAVVERTARQAAADELRAAATEIDSSDARHAPALYLRWRARALTTEAQT